MGESDFSDDFRENLKCVLANVEQELWDMWNLYDECMCYYSDEMKNWIKDVEGNPTENELDNFHQRTKNEATAKV